MMNCFSEPITTDDFVQFGVKISWNGSFFIIHLPVSCTAY